MNKNYAIALRGWVLGLSLASLIAGFFIANVSGFEASVIPLALFLVVVGTALMTGPWGGLAASAIAVFALVLLNQYINLQPLQYGVGNIAAELGIFLAAGPLAGWYSKNMEKQQAQLQHWIAVAERQTSRDPVFDTLTPEMSRLRLEEEVVRAKSYERPLSVAVLKFANIPGDRQQETAAALAGLIRIARSTRTTPAVVSYLGENRILMILPEHSNREAQEVAAAIRERCGAELYFPDGGKSLGVPMSAFGEIRIAVTALGPGHESAETLLQAAFAGLPC